MNNKPIRCIIHVNETLIEIHRNDEQFIGVVRMINQEPVIEFMQHIRDDDKDVFLSFNEIEIVMDNWNQMMEMKRKENLEK